MNALTSQQLEYLGTLIEEGSAEASRALSTWLGREVTVRVEQVNQVSLDAAVEKLGAASDVVCAGCMRFSGTISGQLLLGFDDKSGLLLCDMLLTQNPSNEQWGELSISAAMETTNIVGCAFLNSLSRAFPYQTGIMRESDHPNNTLLPTPPAFVRDYAAAIMQFALMDQVTHFDTVLIAETKFTIAETPIKWHLLLIPDAEVLANFARIIGCHH